MARPNMSLLEELYVEVGRAMHKAQLVEYAIVSAYLLLAKTGPSSERERTEQHWSRMTLGQLLKPVVSHAALPEDAQLFIGTVVAARNHLAHAFFVSDTEIHMPEGAARLMREARAMIDVFDRAQSLFDQLLDNLAKSTGIDLASVYDEARTVVLGRESES
jgi:hypothetical protein